MLLAMIDEYVDKGVWSRTTVAGECAGRRPRPRLRPAGGRRWCGRKKWWLSRPRVPPKGLLEEARRKLQQSRDCANQILKAAMAINIDVHAEMEIRDHGSVL